jgi:predicted TPR repeat methyltransferase
MAKHLTGVDLSGRMIGQARLRNVYDELIVNEVVAFLATRHGQFDLAVAADVFGYIGDLSPILSAAGQALRPGALLAFTIEKHDGDGYVLNPTRRYAHALSYVRSLLPAAAFEEVSAGEHVLRMEKRAEVRGWVMVLRRAKK